jgi:hypothetical protein
LRPRWPNSLSFGTLKQLGAFPRQATTVAEKNGNVFAAAPGRGPNFRLAATERACHIFQSPRGAAGLGGSCYPAAAIPLPHTIFDSCRIWSVRVLLNRAFAIRSQRSVISNHSFYWRNPSIRRHNQTKHVALSHPPSHHARPAEYPGERLAVGLILSNSPTSRSRHR